MEKRKGREPQKAPSLKENDRSSEEREGERRSAVDFSSTITASITTATVRTTSNLRKGVGNGQPQLSCQVDKCAADLILAKRYHRRHKVCEVHSKAAVVIVAGLRQRFCQQCSRSITDDSIPFNYLNIQFKHLAELLTVTVLIKSIADSTNSRSSTSLREAAGDVLLATTNVVGRSHLNLRKKEETLMPILLLLLMLILILILMLLVLPKTTSIPDKIN